MSMPEPMALAWKERKSGGPKVGPMYPQLPEIDFFQGSSVWLKEGFRIMFAPVDKRKEVHLTTAPVGRFDLKVEGDGAADKVVLVDGDKGIVMTLKFLDDVELGAGVRLITEFVSVAGFETLGLDMRGGAVLSIGISGVCVFAVILIIRLDVSRLVVAIDCVVATAELLETKVVETSMITLLLAIGGRISDALLLLLAVAVDEERRVSLLIVVPIVDDDDDT